MTPVSESSAATAMTAPVPPPGWVPFRDLPSRRLPVGPPTVDLAALEAKGPALIEGATQEAACRVCGKAFQARRARIGRTEVVVTVCAACDDAPPAVAEEQDLFHREVPPGYVGTDENHANLHPDFLRAALAWRPNAAGIGLGFSGPTGLGKTRCLCLALRRANKEGLTVGFCSALDLAKLAASQFDDDDARKRLNYLQACRVLLLDDLGKEKLTERVAATFSDLIEHRTAYLLPILWTAQYKADQLIARLGEDRGTAIIRRLREFTQPTRLE